MAFVDVAIGVGTAIGWEGIGTGAATLLGGATLGAGAGALYGGLTGKNMLNSALTGAAFGAGGAYGAGSLGLGSSPAASSFFGNTPALAAASNPTVNAAGLADAAGTVGTAQGVSPAVGQMVSNAGAAEAAGTTAGTAAKTALTGKQMLGYGLAGTSALSLLGGMKPKGLANQSDPGEIRPYEYHTAQRTGADGKPVYFQPVQYNLDGSTVSPMDTSERRYFDQSYTALPTYKAATGGIIAFNNGGDIGGGLADLAVGGRLQNQPANVNFMGDDMYPQSQIQHSYYATPSQMPTSAQQTMASYEPNTNPLTGMPTANFAAGGQLGSYSDGGQMLRGPGDGMSDSIPASISGKQPARLADGEFVVPADVVSHLGNGSTDAGAKRLYDMMDRVRKARTGNKKQGKQIKPEKYLPK